MIVVVVSAEIGGGGGDDDVDELSGILVVLFSPMMVDVLTGVIPAGVVGEVSTRVVDHSEVVVLGLVRVSAVWLNA